MFVCLFLVQSSGCSIYHGPSNEGGSETTPGSLEASAGRKRVRDGFNHVELKQKSSGMMDVEEFLLWLHMMLIHTNASYIIFIETIYCKHIPLYIYLSIYIYIYLSKYVLQPRIVG